MSVTKLFYPEWKATDRRFCWDFYFSFLVNIGEDCTLELVNMLKSSNQLLLAKQPLFFFCTSMKFINKQEILTNNM